MDSVIDIAKMPTMVGKKRLGLDGRQKPKSLPILFFFLGGGS